MVCAIFALLLLQYAMSANGHANMMEPAMRGSMWRNPGLYPDMRPYINYDDNALTAGGPGVVRANYPKRRYGVCGDLYSNARPRAHETGGTFGKWRSMGKRAISRCYKPGSVISIHIRLTAQHMGEFFFTLCVPGRNRDESESCFRKGYQLKQSNGNGRAYQITDRGTGTYKMKYKLPGGVTCHGKSRCVLRWYWLTGNSPGSDMKEEYWNCADIQISNLCGRGKSPRKPSKPPKTVSPTTTKPRRSNPKDPRKAPRHNDCSCPTCGNFGCQGCIRIWGKSEHERACYSEWPYETCADLKSDGYHWCGKSN